MTSVAVGDHVIPLYTAGTSSATARYLLLTDLSHRVPRVQVLQERKVQPVRRWYVSFSLYRTLKLIFPSVRATQGQGVMPDGTSRFTCKGKSLYHFVRYLRNIISL